MNTTIFAAIAGGILLLLIALFVLHRFIPRKPKQRYYVAQWLELQAYCKTKATWPQAIIEADKLLDKGLKRRRFSGRSMGERLVSAQRSLSQNDATWFAHNLRKKISANPNLKLRESDVKNALMGFRQALRDIGALPDADK
jgi:hypothetical protein